MASETIICTIAEDSDRKIEFIEQSSWNEKSYFFRAQVAPAKKGDDWTAREFDTAAAALAFCRETLTKRKRSKRKKIEVPITLRVHHSGFTIPREKRCVTYDEATLHGVNATDGSWRVRGVNGKVESERAENIFSRMPVEVAHRAGEIATMLWKLEDEQRNILHSYDVDLPRPGYGRITVDKAIEMDQSAKRLLGGDDDEGDDNA